MLFTTTYRTISYPAETVFRDRGSKFIACAWPVKNDSEIRARLEELKKLHPSATHHCYAWRLGPDKTAYRVNDDGEPAGSAGKPIYSQIQSYDLTNLLVVVVRYFGGTQLGIPGLIHAYKTATAEVIALAGIEERAIQYEYEINFVNEDTSAVMRLLKEVGAKIIEMNYEAENQVICHIRKDVTDKLEERLTDLYRVKYKPLKLIT